jgi:hypothetical protein
MWSLRRLVPWGLVVVVVVVVVSFTGNFLQLQQLKPAHYNDYRMGWASFLGGRNRTVTDKNYRMGQASFDRGRNKTAPGSPGLDPSRRNQTGWEGAQGRVSPRSPLQAVGLVRAYPHMLLVDVAWSCRQLTCASMFGLV